MSFDKMPSQKWSNRSQSILRSGSPLAKLIRLHKTVGGILRYSRARGSVTHPDTSLFVFVGGTEVVTMMRQERLKSMYLCYSITLIRGKVELLMTRFTSGFRQQQA
ncbi:MAG: hypothetical protein ACTJLK_00870 [Anaplasma sp.]